MTTSMIDNPLGNGRRVQEWIGSSPDAMPNGRVRDRIFLRHNGICHRSGRKIRSGEKWDLDHIKALGLGGENRESNLAPILVEPHKEKTKIDTSAMRKADRQRRKNNGTWPKAKSTIQSRGFEPGRNRVV